ncbi:MAG: acryloyl-CoA reductase [Actinomycetota bacterium]
MDHARAFTVGKGADGTWQRQIVEMGIDSLGEGDVLIAVECSGINFKDGLASTESGKVARIDPLIPGVDLAGTVVSSSDPAFAVGDAVIAHGYDVGVAHHGGFSTLARIPAGWLVPMPDELDARRAMMVGTAGYTSALSVDALERAGLVPGSGPVLVTGATGGVGSMAVGMLAARGYEVVASTGKADTADWLRSLGASDVIDRSETAAESARPLEKERWAGAVDCVGGSTLAYVLRTLRYGASVAASGLTGGNGLATTVLPFILRGANLLGIDSVQTPIGPRRAMWQRIATDLRPAWLDTEPFEMVGLDALAPQLDRILAGGMRGRVLVDPNA